MECRSFLEELENLLRKKVEKNLQDVHAQLPKYEIDDLVRHAEADFALLTGATFTGVVAINNGSLGTPTYTTSSAGTKIILWPNESGSTVDYAIGINTNTMWFSVASTGAGYQWYTGTSNLMSLTTSSLSVGAALTVSGVINANGGITASGTITATNDIQSYVSSDMRLKENITSLGSISDKLDLLRPVEFDWKKEVSQNFDYRHLIGHSYGLIAQEVETVFPDFVHVRPDGYKAIDYEGINVMVLAALKETRNKIKELETRIKELEHGV